MKNLIRIFSVLSVCFCLVSCSIGRTVCNFALMPKDHGQNLEKTRARFTDSFPGLFDWYDSLRTAGVFRDTFIVNPQGLKLHGVFAGAGKDAAGTALIIHGYTVNHISMLHYARMFRDELGFNVILPDLQHHGLSEGGNINMGWYDRLDAKLWVNVADELWHNDFMLVHGVSMGGATTMMLSGEKLPPFVRCFIEDCGYSSVWEQFDYIRTARTKYGPKPLELASQDCKKRFGWDFREASSLDQLAKCDRPMLFIHGDGDDFVPTKFVNECYAAKTKGYKELWVVENTPKHACSYHDHPVEYTEHVREFIEKVRAM